MNTQTEFANPSRRHFLGACAGLAFLAAGCGGEDETATVDVDIVDLDSAEGLRLVTAAEGAAIQSNSPDGLVVLDVRTPDEFAAGHIDGAIMIDFYADDFRDQLAELDPNAPYLLYCRSGNRSGQTIAIMKELGFANVADVDGGMLAWENEGLATVS